MNITYCYVTLQCECKPSLFRHCFIPPFCQYLYSALMYMWKQLHSIRGVAGGAMAIKSGIACIWKFIWVRHPAPCQYSVQQCGACSQQFSAKTYELLLMVVVGVSIQWDGGPLWCGGASIVGREAYQKLE